MIAVVPTIVSVILLGAAEIQSLSFANPESRVFLGPGPFPDTAAVFALENRTLRWIDDDNTGALLLPEGTRVFDIVDVEKDGVRDVFAVVRRDIVRLHLETGDAYPLFKADTSYAKLTGPPEPAVLVVDHEDAPAIALPLDDGYGLFRFDGSLVHEAPENKAGPEPYRKPFATWDVTPPAFSAAGGAETYVSYVREISPEPPAAESTAPPAREDHRIALPGWPSFVVHQDDTTALHALYRRDDGRADRTTIRTARVPTTTTTLDREQAGPEREYPGRIIPMRAMPDFNGDGYADILLWHAPEPAASMQGVTRALAENVWPVRLTAHLFSPGKGRYEPRPSARVDTTIPLDWFLRMQGPSPLRLLVADDFNGDGMDDLALAPDRKTLQINLAKDGTIQTMPDETIAFTETLEDVIAVRKLDPKEGAAIILRSDRAVYVIRVGGP